MGEHPAQAQVRLGGHDAGQRGRIGRQDAAAPKAAVDLDPDVQDPAARRRSDREPGRSLRAVHGEGQRHPPGQAHGTLQLGCGDDLEGDEDRRVDAAVDQRLGLVQLGHGDPDGAGVQLALGDGDRLVGLEVGPQRHPAGARVLGHPADVAVEPIEVDEQGGRVDGPPVPADLGGRLALGRDRHLVPRCSVTSRIGGLYRYAVKPRRRNAPCGPPDQNVGGLMMIRTSASRSDSLRNRWSSSRWILMLSPADSA